jgi:hypothetical protein
MRALTFLLLAVVALSAFNAFAQDDGSAVDNVNDQVVNWEEDQNTRGRIGAGLQGRMYGVGGMTNGIQVNAEFVPFTTKQEYNTSNTWDVLQGKVVLRFNLDDPKEVDLQNLKVSVFKIMNDRAGITAQFFSFLLEQNELDQNYKNDVNYYGAEVFNVKFSREPHVNSKLIRLIAEVDVAFGMGKMINPALDPVNVARRSQFENNPKHEKDKFDDEYVNTAARAQVGAAFGIKFADRVLLKLFGNYKFMTGEGTRFQNSQYGAELQVNATKTLDLWGRYTRDSYRINYKDSDERNDVKNHTLFFGAGVHWK